MPDPPQPTLAALGHVVRALRHEHDMTQAQMADKAAITVQSLGSIENGRANPTLGMMIRLARALGVSLSELIIRAERGQN